VSRPIRELAEWCWTGAVPADQFWKPTGRAEEIAPGVVFLHTFANMTVVRTGAGLVLIDTSNYAARERTFALVRSVDTAPLHAAIYTHGHADHALGLPPFLAQARERAGRDRASSGTATWPRASRATGRPTATTRSSMRASSGSRRPGPWTTTIPTSCTTTR
jgi:glyoxylase-like metal-dependent hydrolase (beta-lactamase superfamily II)